MEFFFAGVYVFTLLCGFIKGDILVGSATLIIQIGKFLSRSGLFILIVCLLYLGRVMGIEEWEANYLSLYTSDIPVAVIALLWLCFPTTHITLMNVMLSCYTFDGPKITCKRVALHVLAIATSMMVVFAGQQFYTDVREQLIRLTLSADKAALLPEYGVMPIDYTFGIVTVTGFVMYITLGLLMQKD